MILPFSPGMLVFASIADSPSVSCPFLAAADFLSADADHPDRSFFFSFLLFRRTSQSTLFISRGCSDVSVKRSPRLCLLLVHLSEGCWAVHRISSRQFVVPSPTSIFFSVMFSSTPGSLPVRLFRPLSLISAQFLFSLPSSLGRLGESFSRFPEG